MALLEDLIKEIADPRLRNKIAGDVGTAVKTDEPRFKLVRTGMSSSYELRPATISRQTS
jgi:hypothetical protein